MEEGESVATIQVVVSGCVRAFKMLPDGRRQIVGFLGPGDLIGHLSDRQIAGCEAVDAVEVCAFPKIRLENACSEERAVLAELDNMLAAQAHRAQELAANLGRKNALGRVAWFLLDRAGRSARRSEIPLPMSRMDIADFLGLRIETISRAFSALKKSAAIATGPSSFSVRDHGELARAAGG